MSNGRYFMTEEAEKARRYDMRQRGRELKAHLATLEHELHEHSKAWKELSETFGNWQHLTFRTDEEKIDVVRPVQNECVLPGRQPTMNKVCSVPLLYFNGESMKRLLSDLEQAKKEREAIGKQLAELGDPL